jgi:hypothetical protein
MQIMRSDTRSDSPAYRERLSPSLWTLVAAALCAPMVALVLSPVDTTIALIGGALVSALIIAALVAASPVVAVTGGELRAGRAHISTALLGEPVALTGEDAAVARGRDLDPRAWLMLRGGIGGVVVVPVQDAEDPVPYWVIASRTPDRLAAVLRRERVTPRTPRR